MKILVLSTWFPYPCNQGSKIRAYHLIKGLAERHDLTLVSFEDVPVLPEWIDAIKPLCSRIEVVPRKPFEYSRRGKIAGWFSLKPSAVVAGYSSEMSARVKQIAGEVQPELVFALTFVTAPYALELEDVAHKVVDADNLLTFMLYEAYLQASAPLERLRRYLAYWKLKHYESEIYRPFDLTLVVSEPDTRRIREYIPLQPRQIGMVANGVDLEQYRPNLADRQPQTLIFNGALTYAPNFDAMHFFLADIFPAIQSAIPETILKITGKTTGVALEQLNTNPGVMFTGYLDDIRPAVASSSVCVVPLRQGAGTRLKILEAMALGTPVVSTSKGAEGLDVENGLHLLIADSSEQFAEHVIRLLKEPDLGNQLAAAARRLVEEKYGWDQIGRHFCTLVDSIAAE